MPIVETITATFTAPGGHVVLVDVATTQTAATTPGTDGATTTGAESVAAALHAVRALDRTADTLAFNTHADASLAPPRPFWVDLVADPIAPSATLAKPPSNSACTGALDGAGAPGSRVGERADLVVVSLPAHAAETVPLDQLALLVAERLRYGGIFAVYTHSDWNEGQLVDPTGAIVAAAQHADLLYLQHIVALHTPVRDGRLHAAPSATVAAEYHRTCHRATERGLPAPHLRTHGDVLVFSQPADRGTPPPHINPAATTSGNAPGTGARR
ncbi:hypothetical protein [Amycolatopsis taiwanensis]|uniref:Uncharacterized protein n=1 Tax=Amycolatopsis taiwanensis TaxID=342230 RepID=A0A9W6R2K6_9PSEU|nr:hypothetical protein [Amycolatopsis taiwanensis]GLY67621.1 hypothetical protein Atai01_42400 [Amycolatopsis taiwanensis]